MRLKYFLSNLYRFHLPATIKTNLLSVLHHQLSESPRAEHTGVPQKQLYLHAVAEVHFSDQANRSVRDGDGPWDGTSLPVQNTPGIKGMSENGSEV